VCTSIRTTTSPVAAASARLSPVETIRSGLSTKVTRGSRATSSSSALRVPSSLIAVGDDDLERPALRHLLRQRAGGKRGEMPLLVAAGDDDADARHGQYRVAGGPAAVATSSINAAQAPTWRARLKTSRSRGDRRRTHPSPQRRIAEQAKHRLRQRRHVAGRNEHAAGLAQDLARPRRAVERHRGHAERLRLEQRERHAFVARREHEHRGLAVERLDPVRGLGELDARRDAEGRRQGGELDAERATADDPEPPPASAAAPTARRAAAGRSPFATGTGRPRASAAPPARPAHRHAATRC
jgi:hypothetical protein